MSVLRISILLSILFLFASCKHEPQLIAEIPDQFLFNFIGHPRMPNEAEVNPQLNLVNWKEEGPLLLGGDIDLKTGALESTIQVYDDLFDFGSPTTLLAFGNHDYQNLAIWESYTNRNSFYTEQLGNICVFVADSQSDKGSIIDNQFSLLENVLDTLTNSTTFVLLTHKLIWMPGHPILMDEISSVPNGGAGDCGFCTSENNFYEDVYPKLKAIQERGIQVICLAGDLGNKLSYYEFRTEDDIQYLANGWKDDNSDNQYLKFYQTSDQGVIWEIVNVEE